MGVVDVLFIFGTNLFVEYLLRPFYMFSLSLSVYYIVGIY